MLPDLHLKQMFHRDDIVIKFCKQLSCVDVMQETKVQNRHFKRMLIKASLLM